MLLRFFTSILCVLLCLSITMLLNFYLAFPEKSLLESKATKLASENQNWIIITTISNITDNIRYLASLPGWKLAVVGDKKTPPNWRLSNCAYLSVSLQKNLGYKIHKYLPHNSYSRKTLGYLYAIQHGAKFIYDTDDDNRPMEKKLKFDFGNKKSIVRAETTPTLDPAFWNPHPYFGQPNLWPRGYPLQKINNKSQIRLKFYPDLKASVIQQGLVNRDPDLDAIYRLLFYSSSSSISFKNNQPVQLGRGVYAPINSQNTLFHYNAFWALYLPVTVNFRVCDIWRGYFALRLLSEINQSMAYHPANAMQIRNAHNYFQDFLDETLMYDKTLSLVETLHRWSCKNWTLVHCALGLARTMAKNNFWGYEEVRNLETWFHDLASFGYVFPKIVKSENV